MHPTGCVPCRNKNRKSGPKSEVSVCRLELFQWKLKSIFAGNFKSFEFSFPGFRENSYPVLQTSAQSFEVREAWMNCFDCKYTLFLSPLKTWLCNDVQNRFIFHCCIICCLLRHPLLNMTGIAVSVSSKCHHPLSNPRAVNPPFLAGRLPVLEAVSLAPYFKRNL